MGGGGNLCLIPEKEAQPIVLLEVVLTGGSTGMETLLTDLAASWPMLSFPGLWLRQLSSTWNNLDAAGGVGTFTWTTRRNGLWRPTEALICIRYKSIVWFNPREKKPFLNNIFHSRLWCMRLAIPWVFPIQMIATPSWHRSIRCLHPFQPIL